MDGQKDVQNVNYTNHAGGVENTIAQKDVYTESTANVHVAREKEYPQTRKKPYEWEYDSKKPSNYQNKRKTILHRPARHYPTREMQERIMQAAVLKTIRL